MIADFPRPFTPQIRPFAAKSLTSAAYSVILSALEFCENALPPSMTAPPGRLTINRQAEGSKGDKSPWQAWIV